MIITELYNGQGLGNQLWCYLVARCIAKKNGYDFGIQSTHKFKGFEFMEIDFGKEVIGGSGPEGGPPTSLPDGIEHYYKEKESYTGGINVSKKDEGMVNIQDNSKLEGCMQSISYIQEYREEIKKWINIKEERNIKDYSADNICIIHIRGGDYHASCALLSKSYYDNCISIMRQKKPDMVFYIVTDDYNYAKYMYPNIDIIGGSSDINNRDSSKASHHIGGPIWMDWTILLNARNIIISASSFAFHPTWLNDNVNVIAPMYWFDYKASNGYWSVGDSLVENWSYLNRDGKLYSYEECLKLKTEYEESNKHIWL